MSFFKAYDMRGTFGVDFTLDDIRKIGYSLPSLLAAKNILVGRDERATSPAIAKELVAALRLAGADVTDIGVCTTPMTYFFTARDGYDAGIMVTASHNPPGDNGLKVSGKTALPVPGTAFARCLDAAVPQNAAPQGGLREVDESARYIDAMRASAPDISHLRFAIDASGGPAGKIARRIFGENAIYLNDTPGKCAHSQNPLLPEAREELVDAVRKNKLDCGAIFDGDADRAMFVDGDGNFIQPDFLIPFVARMCAKPGDTVIYDIRTSRAVSETLAADGFKPVMGKVGHANAKPLMRKLDAACGGELAGHYYFREFFGCDSGVLAALKILGAFDKAKCLGQSVRELTAPVTGKYFNSGEINYKTDDPDALAAELVAKFASRNVGREISRSEIDGIRIDYEHGWICVRRSNTEPLLRLVYELARRDTCRPGSK